MIIRIMTILLLSIPFLGRANDDIIVRLATESKLLPIYVTPIRGETSALSLDYLKEVEAVLRFDLDHNGMTNLAKKSPDKTLRSWQGNLSAGKDNVYYAVTLEVEGKDLSARVVSVSNGTVRTMENLLLEGDLRVDRRVMHQLADAIHEILFQKPGIASTRILYTVRNKNPSTQGPDFLSEAYEAEWDGENVRQVTFDGSYCISPAYLPPKKGYASGSFFYVSYKSGQPKIYIASLQASERPQRLVFLRGNQLMPAVAANRMQVGFVNDVTGNPDLFVQKFDPDVGTMGKPYQIFSTKRGTQASPSFSPDGTQVAFVSNKDGSPRIYIMDIPKPGTRIKDLSPKRISLTNRENTGPSWSPDGRKIAYSSKTNGTRQIWIYDFPTGQERQLTSGPGHKENPSWAANSLHLVFNSATPSSCELFIINLNQPSAVRISRGIGEKRFPNWEMRL